MQKSGAEIVIETLIAHGIKDVFGYPGGAVLPIYDAIYRYSSKINHYITCHEQGATHAADGYARATGKPGVVIATSGPGATNLVTGIATAYLDSVPLIAITGNVALDQIGKDSFQEIDIHGITLPITKHNYFVTKIEDLEEIICEAFKIATSGRPGPILIDIPKSIQNELYNYKSEKPYVPFPIPTINMSEVSKAANIINNSKKPYIYCGGGVIHSSAHNEVIELAKKINAPIGCSLMGLSSVNYTNPLALGLVGMHGSYQSSKMKAESDLIIGIGVRFSDRATGDRKAYKENTQVIHIDIDPTEIGKNIPIDCSIQGDIKNVLPEIIKLVNQNGDDKWINHKNTYTDMQPTQDNIIFNPRNIIKTVRNYSNENTVVTTDVGQHQMWVAQHYGFELPRKFLTSGGLGTMGFGVGAAIGASISSNKSRTICFTGDASFHMNMNEIATAVLYETPIIVVIMNNNALGMVRQWQDMFYDKRHSNTSITRETNYKMFAESFGAIGFDAFNLDELNNALKASFESNKQCIINCVIDFGENVYPMIPAGKPYSQIIVK